MLTGPLFYSLRHPRDFFSSVGPTLNELTFGALGSSFEPECDIGDLTGKVIFVTGGMSPVLYTGFADGLTQ